MFFKLKLNRKILYNKLLEYKKNKRNQENVNEYIKMSIELIEEFLNKYALVKDNNYILGERQKFVLEEFERYINEGNYEGAYYDIEDFIGFERIPIDIKNGLKESEYISQIEANKILYMINIKKIYNSQIKKET